MLQLLALLAIVFCAGTVAGEEYIKRQPRRHEITLTEALKILDQVKTGGNSGNSFYDGQQEGWM